MTVDTTRSGSDLQLADTLLAPTIAYLETVKVDMWTLMCWLFVSYYWTVLDDLGQISPTTYIPLHDWASANFSQAIVHPTTNNIFVNETLFDVFGQYLKSTILPLLQYHIGDFSPLSAENSLEPSPTTFLRIYNCTERRLKATVSWFYSVFTAVWSIMAVLFLIVTLTSSAYAHRHLNEKGLPSHLLINVCSKILPGL